ncbi:apolipoprotein N-acyltransferase [Thiovibrio sp. JS02]
MMTSHHSPPRRQEGGFALSCAFALASSALLFFASPGEQGGLPLLAWVALLPLFIRLPRHTPGQAAALGLLCGLAYYGPLLYWIVIVLATYGEVPLLLACLALFFLAVYMSCFLAAFSFLCAGFSRTLPLLVAAPVLWVGLDLVRSLLFTGFPWLDLGYTQHSLPLVIQIADLAGHHGVSFLIVLANGLAAALFSSSPRAGTKASRPAILLAAGLILCLAFAYNAWRLATLPAAMAGAERMTVAVAQGNFPQNQKWLPAFQAETVETYLRLSREAIAEKKPRLLVWPETALPFYPYENPLFSSLQSKLTHPYGVALLTGAPHRERKSLAAAPSYFNSAFLLTPEGTVAGRYDKQHLVPFGEYIPLRGLLAFASPVVETLGDFSPGVTGEPLSCQNGRIGVLICFESIFPELARRQAANGANLLVNITNDAWFGRSSAPWQHLSMAVFRAVETRKSLVRGANTGISAFIDPLGRIRAASPLFRRYAKSEEVVLLAGKSPYVRFGHLFPWACLGAGAAVGLCFLVRKRKDLLHSHH